MIGRFGAVFFVVLLVVATLLGLGIIGMIIALVFAGAITVLLVTNAESFVVSACKGQPADEVSAARFHNVLEGLCVNAGVTRPKVFIVDDSAANALCTGHSPKRGVIVITSGLLELLDRVELEGVVAHLLCQIKSGDAITSTIAIPMLATRSRLKDLPERRAQADLEGVALTRYPPGLISALEKLTKVPVAPANASKSCDALWFVAPHGESQIESAQGTFGLPERIERLREL